MDLHRWSLQLLRDVYELAQTRDTQGDVLRGNTGVVKRVQGHLRGRLPDALGSEDTAHFPGSGAADIEPVLNFAQQPLKCFSCQAVGFDDASGSQA